MSHNICAFFCIEDRGVGFVDDIVKLFYGYMVTLFHWHIVTFVQP